MIHPLKEIFPSFAYYANTDVEKRVEYAWFMSDSEEVIGVLKDQMSDRELSLLQTFLSPYNHQFPLVTEREKRWQLFIQNELADVPVKEKNFRFVAFSFARNQLSPAQFKNAICELFAYEVPILWRSETEGILIEEIESEEDCISYEQIIDVLMSDLYVKIKFLVGPVEREMTYVLALYNLMQEAFSNVFEHANKQVLSYVDAFPYLLIYGRDFDRHLLKRLILRGMEKDEEVLKMIVTFVDCNSNLSETAKMLHLHRNSLQYRIERLSEKTGLDIRKFHHVMVLYLAILIKD